jgi:regulator of replication initiation timing
MVKKESVSVVPDEIVMNKIYIIRNHKVMLDRDLAELYHIETKVLKQSVKRNIDIFPEHFMFELTELEFEILRSQFVTSKDGRGGARYLPMVFTEHGILQLSNVVRSGIAKQMSIRIIEVFVKMRQMLSDNTELRLDIEKIKRKLDNQDKNMEIVFRYLDELLDKKENPKPRVKIGYKLPKK